MTIEKELVTIRQNLPFNKVELVGITDGKFAIVANNEHVCLLKTSNEFAQYLASLCNWHLAQNKKR